MNSKAEKARRPRIGTSGRGGDYKGKPKEFRVIEPQEVARMLKCAAIMAEGKTSHEWMLVYLGWITGAKLKELVSIPIGRVSFHYHEIRPGTKEDRVPIELTEKSIKPLGRYFDQFKLAKDSPSQFERTQYKLFNLLAYNPTPKPVHHADKHKIDRPSSLRWAQEAFKKLLRGAQIDKPYSVSSLRNLFRQTMGEVTGAYPALVDYVSGNDRYQHAFDENRTLAFRRRAAEHFERVLRQVEVL